MASKTCKKCGKKYQAWRCPKCYKGKSRRKAKTSSRPIGARSMAGRMADILALPSHEISDATMHLVDAPQEAPADQDLQALIGMWAKLTPEQRTSLRFMVEFAITADAVLRAQLQQG